MKLGDIDIEVLIHALRQERLAWIKVAREEKRRVTDSEQAAVLVLYAIEGALSRVVGTYMQPPQIAQKLLREIEGEPVRKFEDG